MAQNEMRAKRGLPQGVRLNTGLGLARCTLDDLNFMPLDMSALYRPEFHIGC